MAANTHTKPGVYGFGHVVTAEDIRDVARDLGFELRKSGDQDPRQSELTIRHPQDEKAELIIYIDVENVFRRENEYRSVSIFTHYKQMPLNVPGHPLNISVGLSHLYDLTMLHNILQGIAVRFRGIDVDETVKNWYRL